MADPDDAYASLHDAYAAHPSPADYYRAHGRDYRNPHERVIAELIALVAREWPVDFSHTLDLSAGSGEVTLAVQLVERASRPLNAYTGETPVLLEATDPYTAEAYTARTGRACEPLSFEQIAARALAGRSYTLVACSFAMHLCEPSRLPALCWALADVSPQLLILTPHKRPALRREWRWELTHEMTHDRVRARLYARTTV